MAKKKPVAKKPKAKAKAKTKAKAHVTMAPKARAPKKVNYNAPKQAYRVAFDDVGEIVVQPHDKGNSAPFRARIIHGTEASMILASRAPGYHTQPHVHDAEQWNYILSGEMWFFVEGNAYWCKPGDCMRIPRNRPHWAWNRGTELAVIYECHSPRMTADNQHNHLIHSLLGTDEDPKKVRTVTNAYIEYDKSEIGKVEERAIAAELKARGIKEAA